jgi:uncharacterized membrane protein
MKGIKEVRQLDAKHLHWKADIGGREKEWDAEITAQTPDQQIAWKTIGGATNQGTVTFEPVLKRSRRSIYTSPMSLRVYWIMWEMN